MQILDWKMASVNPPSIIALTKLKLSDSAGIQKLTMIKTVFTP